MEFAENYKLLADQALARALLITDSNARSEWLDIADQWSLLAAAAAIANGQPVRSSEKVYH